MMTKLQHLNKITQPPNHTLLKWSSYIEDLMLQVDQSVLPFPHRNPLIKLVQAKRRLESSVSSPSITPNSVVRSILS